MTTQTVIRAQLKAKIYRTKPCETEAYEASLHEAQPYATDECKPGPYEFGTYEAKV